MNKRLIINLREEIGFKPLLKKYLFPYREIKNLERIKSFYEKDEYKKIQEISNYNNLLNRLIPLAVENDLKIKKNLSNIDFRKLPISKRLTDSINTTELDLILEKYEPYKNILLRGINNPLPASSYLQIYDENIFLLSSIGVLAHSSLNSGEFSFKQIKNNIGEFIGKNQFYKDNLGIEEAKERLWFSTKDLLIFDNKVFVSFSNEIQEDCWNTSIIYGDLNFNKIVFRPFFVPNECINSKNNPDNVFNGVQSGGRIVAFDKSHVIFSTGDYRNRFLAQDEESTFGKILKISIDEKTSEVLSLGSRNIQGLFFDQKNKFIIFTEHGPRGGDEINLLPLEIINKEIKPNYGWPISSYGEHYSPDRPDTKKYPLYKSHEEYGFIEPLKYFTPSIGISELVGINSKKRIYAVSSLKDHGLYFIYLNEMNQISKVDRLSINERIRDLISYENKLYLFLEDTGSIGVINLNNF